MISILKITKGNDSAKNVGGMTVVNLCTLSGMLYISTKFCEMTDGQTHGQTLKSSKGIT